MLITSLTSVAVTTYIASAVLPYKGMHDWIYPGAIFRNSNNAVALTFDDGPHPERTSEILDLLAENEITATFFLIGERAERYPDIVRRIVSEGHTVGNHSWSHPWLPRHSSRVIRKELYRCQEVLADITEQYPVFVRPPYGSRDFRFYRIARELNLMPVIWSISTHDWAGVTVDRVTKQLMRSKQSEIILLHDGNTNAIATIPALRKCLPELKEKFMFSSVLAQNTSS